METLNVNLGIRFFNQYCIEKFNFATDHESLLSIFRLQKGMSFIAMVLMPHCLVFTEKYTYKIELRKTQHNTNAEGLSYLPLQGK